MNSILPNANPNATEPDVVLVGAGIMSATLGVLLKEVEPALTITIVRKRFTTARRRVPTAGTMLEPAMPATASCTTRLSAKDGSVDISKALEVNTEFDLSRQLVVVPGRQGARSPTRAPFIRPCPHMSFVWGWRVMSGSCISASKRCRRTTAFMAWSTARTAAKLPNGRRSSWRGRDDSELFRGNPHHYRQARVDYGALTHLAGRSPVRSARLRRSL